MYIALCLSLLLTFSYKIVEVIIKRFSANLVRYSLYFWAVGILILVPFFKWNYIINSPSNIIKVMPVFLILLIANCIASRYSGYNPVGKFNTINFIIVWPVIEEIVFRGLILPYLNQYLATGQIFEFIFLPVSYTVIISALLFAICHLQYYKLSRQSTRFMVFAFVGGITFGGLADITHSILLTCVLHIEFNFLAVYFAKKSLRNRS
ncbi:CPBP family intramembrane metalloprotease [Paenibacillus anaericanus]|uniref:CPBP family intramembrane metalloprotease n=1 Tax=Paenibacillus anaericanus TaxID=170367 RepID=A0A3S1DPU6_9BACL|nr:CPBP family intramembrane metalloprotease [Paenibacillus anaericanus]